MRRGCIGPSMLTSHHRHHHEVRRTKTACPCYSIARSSSSGSLPPCMRPITSASRCSPFCSSQCIVPLPAPCPASARSRISSASDSRKRPRFASSIAASNADTERACSPSTAWHRPMTFPALTFDAALKLNSACNSAAAKLQLKSGGRCQHTRLDGDEQKHVSSAPDGLFVPPLPLEHLGNQHTYVREGIRRNRTIMQLRVVDSWQVVEPRQVEVAFAHRSQAARHYRLKGCDGRGLQGHVMQSVLGRYAIAKMPDPRSPLR